MKCFFFLGVIITMISFLFGCSSFGYQSPHYAKLAEKITEKTAIKLLEKKQLFLIGTGGQMMHDIQVLDMSFQYYHEVDLQTARELILSAINEYLSEINNNDEIRQYLHEYPFTAKNVEIHIWFYNSDRSTLSKEKIYYVSSINGILDYYIRGEEKYSRKELCEETFQDAMKKISSK